MIDFCLSVAGLVMILLGFALVVAAPVVGLVGAAVKSARGRSPMWAFRIALAGLVTLAAGISSVVGSRRLQHAFDLPSLERVATRAEPIVAGIAAYERVHGRPPAELTELVPQFLAEVPGTGWSRSSRYEYVHRGDGTWRLWVDCGVFLAFDEFVYDPTVLEPEQPGYIDRVGDWYYLHE